MGFAEWGAVGPAGANRLPAFQALAYDPHEDGHHRSVAKVGLDGSEVTPEFFRNFCRVVTISCPIQHQSGFTSLHSVGSATQAITLHLSPLLGQISFPVRQCLQPCLGMRSHVMPVSNGL